MDICRGFSYTNELIRLIKLACYINVPSLQRGEMTINPRKRQKQLARKAARASAKAKTIQASGAQRAMTTTGFPVSAASWPVHEALISESVQSIKQGTVIFSRNSGELIAVAVFLVDTGCLGIKSAFSRVMSATEYDHFMEKFRMSENFIAARPECLRKLIEEAEAYAANLGFSPDPDHRRVKVLFGDIDSGTCTQEFEFGQNGKPFYVAGPNDSPGRIQAIIKRLGDRCGGPEGFHFMVGSSDFYDDSME